MAIRRILTFCLFLAVVDSFSSHQTEIALLQEASEMEADPTYADLFEEAFSKTDRTNDALEPKPRGHVSHLVGSGQKEIHSDNGLHDPIAVERCATCQNSKSVFVLEKARVSRFEPGTKDEPA